MIAMCDVCGWRAPYVKGEVEEPRNGNYPKGEEMFRPSGEQKQIAAGEQERERRR